MDELTTEDITATEDTTFFRFVDETRVVQPRHLVILRRTWRCSEYTVGGWSWNWSVERAQGGFMDGVKEDRKSIEADDWL